MAQVGVERETLVSEPDAPTTRPPPCGHQFNCHFDGILTRPNQLIYNRQLAKTAELFFGLFFLETIKQTVILFHCYSCKITHLSR